MFARTTAFKPYAALVVALLVLAVGRLMLFDWWVSSDEAGFLLVAQGLGDGDNLYGRYWVDRPPTLIWIFALGDLLGGLDGIRVLAGCALATFVVLLHEAARRTGASTAWAMVVTVPILIAPVFAAQVANGESFAIPFVMASVLAVLVATSREGRSSYVWAFASGFLGLLAVTVKQNFAEGLVFAFVLLLVDALRRERAWATTLRLMLAGLAGALTTTALMMAYALTTTAGPSGLWVAAVSFRTHADAVLQAGQGREIESIQERGDELFINLLQLGLAPLLVAVLVVVLWSRFRGSAAAWATAAMVLVELASVVLGGNFWPHYVLGLAPGLGLAAGLAATRLPLGWAVRVVAVWVAVALLIETGQDIREQEGSVDLRGVTVGRWVADSAEPGDTATSLYGLAYTQRATGMDSPYRHLWSLPARVLDPDLDELTSLLRGDDAPTWLVLSFSIHAWGLDPEEQIDPVLRDHYDLVLHACHMLVYRLESEPRDLAPPPDC